MKKTLKYILGIKQLCKLRLKGKHNTVTLLNVYAPTEDKQQFYEDLQTVVDKVPKSDILILYTWSPKCKIRGKTSI
jgi:hypothetical protein